MKIDSQGKGGKRWKPVGFSFSFFRYIRANFKRQYQAFWVWKKMYSRSSWIFFFLNPLNPHILAKILNLLCRFFNYLTLYIKFFVKICAIFLLPVLTKNQVIMKSEKDCSCPLCLMIS